MSIAEERSGTVFRNITLRKTASLNFRTPDLYLAVIFESDKTFCQFSEDFKANL